MRYCQNPNCGKELKRKKRPDGTPERLSYFKVRQYCDIDCYNTLPGRNTKRKRPQLMNRDQRRVMRALNRWAAV